MIKNKVIVITGASGYIAGALATRLNEMPCEIRRVSRNRIAPLPKGKARVKDFARLPSKSEDWQQMLSEAHAIIHCAALTSVYAADNNPQQSLSANVELTQNLLEGARLNGNYPLVIFSGTVTQAGMTKRMPVNETILDRPITLYDIHKLQAEQHVLHYATQNWLQGCSLRLPNVYGPSPGQSSASDRGVVNMMAKRALGGQNLTLYGDGKQLRDYIYIDDVVEVFLAAVAAPAQVNQKYFVIGTGKARSISDAFTSIAKKTHELFGFLPKIIRHDWPLDTSLIEYRDFVADSTVFSEATNWQAETDFEDGLERTLRHFAEQKSRNDNDFLSR